MKIVGEGQRHGEWGRAPGSYNVRATGSPMQYGPPKSRRIVSWLDEQAWQLFGTTREVSKPWVSSGETPGWAVQPWPSPVLLQSDSILLQIVPARAAGESGHLQSAARGRLCGVKVSATMRHGMASMARRSLTRLPHSLRRLIHGERERWHARMLQRFTRYGRSRVSIRLRQHSDWAAMSLPREASYTANVRAP